MSVFYPVKKSLWLQQICEANFHKLCILIPDMLRVEDNACASCIPGMPKLHLRTLERSAYTVTMELTHDFSVEFEALHEPAVRIRVCFDSRTAEVLNDHERPTVNEVFGHDRNHGAILDYKWSLNYFLNQWLDHCLSKNYRFRVFELEEIACP